MKALIKIFVLSFVLSVITWIAPSKASAQVQVSVDFQIFYDDLSPYGSWVDNSNYGYVWAPDVSYGFTPYGTDGYWVFTDDGWAWVSNYSWGWAPFHYGRWFYDSYYGWLWAPDSEWGPGWVTWRRSEGYYGWAPIGPGISIDLAYSNGYSLPYNQWNFVRDRDFGRTNIYNYYVNSSSYTTIINNSTVINNIYTDGTSNVRYNTGPDRNDVERQAGKTFTPFTIKESNNREQRFSGNQLEIYRPRVQKNVLSENKPAPSRVGNMKDLKPVMQRNNEAQRPGQDQPNRQPLQNDQRVKQQQQPRDNLPIRQQPARNTDNQPANQRPRENQPVKQQPERKTDNRPANQQPQDNRPVRQQPVRNTDNKPANQQPRDNQQVKQQPVKKTDNKPANQPPPRQKPDAQPKKVKENKPHSTH